MAITIDNLEIQIQSEAKKATGGIDALSSSLKNLKSAIGDTSGLASNLTQIANALKSFNSVGKINLTSPVKQLEKLNGLIPTLGGGQATQLAQNLRDIADGLNSFSSIQKVSITPVANGIKSLNDATKGLDTTRLREFSLQMSAIADGLSKLSGVGKINVGSTINSLAKIPDITNTLKPEVIEEFANKIRQLTIVMTPLAEQMDKVARGFNALPNSIKRATNATNQAVTANAKADRSFKALTDQLSKNINKYQNLYYAAKRFADILAEWFNESNSYIENLNLFTVSMGDATDAATEYAEAVSEAMGIDVAEWMQNQGVFMRMATGFGIVSDEAELMSQNLTQLAYDLSSFFNTDVETAMQKLQSGMSGQIKGLKAWGYNLSVAALQETALSLGIEESVRSMSEAEKAQLRYITLIQRSNGIMGDMAKTITSPANAMRILDAQMTKLKRSLGNLVSVLVTKFIPWLMAAVELMTEFAETLADAWGFEVPEFPEVDLELGSDDIEETEEELASLKKQLMGFDELNILKSDNEGDSDSWLNDFELPEYDFLNGLEGLDLEPYKEKLKEILDLVKLIGITMLAWKVGTGLADFINLGLPKLTGLFNTGSTAMPAIAGSAGTFASKLQLAAGAAVAVVGAFTEFKGVKGILEEGLNFEDVANTLIGSGGVVLGGTLIGKALGGAIAGEVGAALGVAIGGSIGAIAAGLMMFVPATADAIEEGVDLESVLLSTGGGALTGAGIGMLIGGPIGAAIGAGIGAGIAGATQGVIAAVQECASDCIEAVDIFDETISESTKTAVGPFLEDMRELSNLSFEWEVTGKLISQEDVETFGSRVDEIVNIVTTELSADKLSVLDDVSLLEGFLSEDELDSIRMSLDTFYDDQIGVLNSNQEKINEILNNAASENRNLTTEEWSEINRIQSEMQNTGVMALSESAIEYETIMRNLKDNATRMSLEQASEVIKNAQATRDETIAAAETQYSELKLQADNMLAIGAINEEQYNAMIDAAKEAKDKTIADANEQYDSIYKATKEKLGDTAKYIDEETGEIKSKWTVFWDDVGQGWTDFWDGLGETCTTCCEVFVKGWKGFFDWFGTAWDGFWEKVGNFFSGNGWKLNSEISANVASPAAYASGGFPSMGEMFIARENGPELVGRIGNKNAVANNNQIVSGIASAVYSAMMAAKEDGDGGSGSPARIIVQIGDQAVGEASVRYINGRIVQTGENPIYA